MAMHAHLATIYTGSGDGAREDQALGHLEAAAAIADSDPDSVEKGLVYQRAAHLYLHRGDPTTATAWAQRAVDLFRRLGVPMGTSLGTARAYTGHVAEGLAYNEDNWDAVVKIGNPLIVGVLAHELTLLHALLHDVARAVAWGERGLGELRRAIEATRLPSAHFENFARRPLALAYVLAGENARAAEQCRRVEELQTRGLAPCVWEDAGAVGLLWLRRGDFDEARTALEGMLSAMEERSQHAAISGCAFVFGSLELALGHPAEAARWLRRSLDTCRRGGNVLFESWILPALAESRLAAGDADDARAHLERARALLAPDRDWRGLPAAVERTAGLLARERRDWDAAAAAFATAIDLSRRYRLPWDEGRALAERARLYAMRGWARDREAAAADRTAAREIFTRIEARGELARLETT
jgi:tetratricopeptide (TPR) repeat protein